MSQERDAERRVVSKEEPGLDDLGNWQAIQRAQPPERRTHHHVCVAHGPIVFPSALGVSKS